MKIYLVSNNSLLDHLNYESDNIELIRMLRPLGIEGEEIAKKISTIPELKNVNHIYSSFFSSAISSSKYLSDALEIPINLNMNLNDCKVGILGNKTMKMLKECQEHDFNYKLTNGESLNDVGNRINEFIKNNISDNSVLFTHKRAILGFLLKYTTKDYNLDDNLLLLYNNEIVYEDDDSDFDIYEIEYNDGIQNIRKL